MRFWMIFIWFAFSGPLRAEDALRLGIFGLVEATDPLVVAGRTIAVPDSAPVISPLGPDAEFEVGDTLAVVATVVKHRLVAMRMLQVFAVAGPLTDVAEGKATIMGTTVHIPPGADARTGQWVAISGLWSAETVITSRIRRIDWEGFGQLAGVVETSETDGASRIGSSTLIVDQTPKNGFGMELWTLTGTPEGAGLHVRLLSKGVFGGEMDMVLWQGYVSPPVASQTYAIHGSGITGSAADALMPEAGSRVSHCAVKGRVSNSVPKGMETAFELLECAKDGPAD